ncbi:hypothetical protein ACTQ5K_02705 [Niallia sp. Sow4_A1]|uniref:hypothetical protein n=1 Tax=Niallia sp. Sow4_A1 TaxID=3438793 RepID=UPI003F9BD1F4
MIIANALSIGVISKSKKMFLLDRFNRPDGTVGNAETGQPWSIEAGTFEIRNKQLMLVQTSGQRDFISAETGLSDFVVNVTFVNNLSGSRVFFRALDGGKAYFMSNASGIYKLYRDSTQIAQTNLAVPSPNDKIKVIVKDNLIKCFVNGIEVMSVEDGAYPKQTKIGVGSWNTSGMIYDDIIVEEL